MGLQKFFPVIKCRSVSETISRLRTIHYKPGFMSLQIRQYGIENLIVCVPFGAPAPEILINPTRGRKNAKIIVEINKVRVVEYKQLIIGQGLRFQVIHAGSFGKLGIS